MNTFLISKWNSWYAMRRKGSDLQKDSIAAPVVKKKSKEGVRERPIQEWTKTKRETPMNSKLQHKNHRDEWGNSIDLGRIFATLIANDVLIRSTCAQPSYLFGNTEISKHEPFPKGMLFQICLIKIEKNTVWWKKEVYKIFILAKRIDWKIESKVLTLKAFWNDMKLIHVTLIMKTYVLSLVLWYFWWKLIFWTLNTSCTKFGLFLVTNKYCSLTVLSPISICYQNSRQGKHPSTMLLMHSFGYALLSGTVFFDFWEFRKWMWIEKKDLEASLEFPPGGLLMKLTLWNKTKLVHKIWIILVMETFHVFLFSILT